MKNVASMAMGRGLRFLGELGGAEWIDRWGLRPQATRLVEQGARAGFRAAQNAGQRFKPVLKLVQPSRLERPAHKPELFDLNITDEQQMTRDTLRRFAEDVMRPAARSADDKCLTPQELLDESMDLGLTLMALPEGLGGAGTERSPVSNALIIEDLAYGDMGIALAMLAPLGVVNLLVDFGTAAQQSKYLSPLAEAGFVGSAIAVSEPTPLFDAYRLRTRAQRTDAGYVLNGTKTLVPLGSRAELFLVAALSDSGEPELFIVERDAKGLAIFEDHCMGLRAADLARLELRDVRVSREARVGGDQVAFCYSEVIDRARIGWSAMAVGAGQSVLDYVIPYCNERFAFGEPITNRQSVAFLMADMALELDGMRLLTQRAASRAERGSSFQREAYLARLQASEKGMKIGSDGVQLLGGHGFVKEHPVELWYRQLRAIGVVEGALYV